MKQFMMAACFLLFCFSSQAQLGGVINNAKRKAEQKVNEKVDEEIDKQVDGETPAEPGPAEKAGEQQQTGSAATAKEEAAPLKV